MLVQSLWLHLFASDPCFWHTPPRLAKLVQPLWLHFLPTRLARFLAGGSMFVATAMTPSLSSSLSATMVATGTPSSSEEDSGSEYAAGAFLFEADDEIVVDFLFEATEPFLAAVGPLAFDNRWPFLVAAIVYIV